MTELAERLGYEPDSRLVIISCDDLGLSHASNVGVYRALREGAATCASVMIPAPWARHAAAHYDGEDVGVHLTLNAEHDHYRWGPVTFAPSLLSGDGGFPTTIEDLWQHADPAEAGRELRVQVDRALAWGFDVTHLAPHLSAILLRPEFFDLYLELAVEHGLPIRLPSAVTEAEAGFPFRRLAREAGVVFPDYFDHDWRPGSRRRVMSAIPALLPGVTELHVQPAVDCEEIRALSPHAPGWIADLELIVSAELRQLLADHDVIPIGYRQLRNVMRRAA